MSEHPEDNQNPWSFSAMMQSISGSSRQPVQHPSAQEILHQLDEERRYEIEQVILQVRYEYETKLQDIHTGYQTQLSTFKQNLELTQRRCLALQQQRDELQQQHKANEAKLELEFNERVHLKERTIQDLEIQLDRATHTHADYEASVKRHENQVQAYRSRIEELEELVNNQDGEITHLKSEITKLKSRPLPTPQRGQSSKPSAPESLSDFDTASSVAEDRYPHDDYSVARLNTTTVDINPKHRRYATPIFRGNGKDDPLEWLLAFEKLQKFYKWTDEKTISEFMMALHGHAALWWDNVEGDTENLTYKQIKSLFTDYFGGDDAAVSAAIAKMVILRQNKESMVTFGTKLMTHIRRSTNESPMQMYFFYRAVDKDTAQMVARREPKTLKEAVDYAIRMERLDLERRAATSDDFNRGVAQLISFGNPGKNSTSVPHADSDSEPMEGVIHGTINAQQRSRKLARKSPQDSGCYVCGKSGHIAKECYSRHKKGDNKQKRGYGHHKKSYRQNEQAVRPASVESDIEEESNLFAHMYNLNCQQVESIYNETQTISTNAMTEKELENDPRRFSVNMQLSGQNVSVLIDTGAMISTIRDDQVDQLQLTQESAPNMWIEYGNSSREVSNTTVSIQFQVEEAAPFNFPLRVVSKQNVPVILGMDFFLKTSVLLDPINKTIVPRHNTETAIQQQEVQKVNNNNEGLIPEISEAMKLYPLIFKTESIQSITNAPVEHQIDTGDARPIVKKGRRLSPKEKQALQDEVDKMLKAKVIRPSNSPWSSPPILVPKPDGSMRLCNNYRGINAVTKKDKYPLPRMDDLIDKLSGAQWFSSIDLKSGYWQIPVAEQDKCKTAFTTPSGLYEYNVMPFGLTNAPATFARFMAQILGTFPNAIVYLDDVLIFSPTREAHKKHVFEVLRILNQWNLKLNLAKCKFFQQEAAFLGFIVTRNGLKSNPAKVDPIRTWPRPSSSAELQSFLGLCNFYHRFIHNLSSLAAPLYRLLKKNVPWSWKKLEEDAFQALKSALISLPELSYPDSNLPYALHCDASDTGVGAVLVQGGRPVAYASKSLTPAQRNYNTTERECLAVAWALQYFHCYVHGCPSLTVYTDHAALKAILSTKEPKGRIARWIIDIMSYDFVVVHKKGVDNQDADALSRLPSRGRGKGSINQNTQTISMQNNTFSKENIRKLQAMDPDAIKYSTIPLKQPFTTRDDLLYRQEENKLMIVLPRKLRLEFMNLIHTNPVSGAHQGRDKSLARAKENAWWPSITQDVIKFVKNCVVCQKHKTPTHKFVELKSIVVSEPCEVWAADVAYLPETTRGNKYLLVFMDYFTKWMVTTALPSFDTNSVANVLLYSVVLTFGTPAKWITDNGRNFISEAMYVVCNRLGIKKTVTSVEHPQSDGMVERMNRTIKTALATYVEEIPDQWDIYLPFVTFAINTSKSASTGYSPFEAMFGRQAKLPGMNEVPMAINLSSHNSKTWFSYLSHFLPIIHNNIRQNLQQSQERQQRYFNKNRKEKETLKVNDEVYKVKMKQEWKFPKPKFTGPWIVKDINKDGSSFKLEKNENNRVIKTTANIRDIYKKYSHTFTLY